MIVTDPKDIAHAEAAAGLVVETHRRLVGFLRVGQTLAEIDARSLPIRLRDGVARLFSPYL